MNMKQWFKRADEVKKYISLKMRGSNVLDKTKVARVQIPVERHLLFNIIYLSIYLQPWGSNLSSNDAARKDDVIVLKKHPLLHQIRPIRSQQMF